VAKASCGSSINKLAAIGDWFFVRMSLLLRRFWLTDARFAKGMSLFRKVEGRSLSQVELGRSFL
jgi:hypothetical protein